MSLLQLTTLWQMLEEIPGRSHAIALHLVAILERAVDVLAQAHQNCGTQGVSVKGEAIHQICQRPSRLDPDSHGSGGQAVRDGRLAIEEEVLILHSQKNRDQSMA